MLLKFNGGALPNGVRTHEFVLLRESSPRLQLLKPGLGLDRGHRRQQIVFFAHGKRFFKPRKLHAASVKGTRTFF